MVTSALIEKRAEKRRKKGKLENQLLLDSDEEEEDTYFRQKGDLKFSNLEWKDIKSTRLGRQIEDKINLYKGEIKNLDHKIKLVEKSKATELERLAN